MLGARTTPAAGAAHARPGPADPGPASASPHPDADAPELTAGDPTGRAVAAVEHLLAGHLAGKLREARAVDPVFAEDVVARLVAFVGRGGKRLRCAFAWCGWQAGGGAAGDAAAVVRVGAALELLQACALIHDDVMDGSPRRRGAPAMHTEFAAMHRAGGLLGEREGFAASAAILAGDLVLAWADDLLAETALASPHGAALQREWAAMRGEMVAGQYLDVRAQAAGSSSVADAVRIACLKSALYTVERPLALGAVAAGASPAAIRALRAAGHSAGLAFQLRDDLLGAFGDPADTGKPADEDLRTRKLTYLLAVAAESAERTGDAEAVRALAAGGPRPGGRDVAAMRAAIERTGARAAVETRIARLARESLGHFAESGAAEPVRREFAALVGRAAGTPAGSRTEDV
ncbi:polyprenyl synthetase family protein [Streptomyces sp. ODS05-4]|uniref:polyprenyl synthetase family protein n=1 Tax=Streptomyces sp. ODS05-4 TaxID=2944939 RepID=UPI0035B2D834